MTLRPLTFDFPLMTPPVDRGENQPPLILSRRAPWTIEPADMCGELARELSHRRSFYPRLVAESRMKQSEADHHIALLDAIHRDMTGIDVDRAATGTWDPKVRELRREIAMRRALWPKRIAAGRMREADATPHMEALEAVHFQYWIRLDHWDMNCGRPPETSGALDGEAATLSTRLEPIRRQQALVQDWLWHAHQAADPAIAGYLTPEQIAWHQAHQQERQAA